jgi:hypothetical protein
MKTATLTREEGSRIRALNNSTTPQVVGEEGGRFFGFESPKFAARGSRMNTGLYGYANEAERGQIDTIVRAALARVS